MAEEDETLENDEELDGEGLSKPSDIDPDTLSDGAKTVFVGGWSELKTLSAGLAKCATGDALYCHGGEYDEVLNLSGIEVVVTGPTDLSCVLLQGVVSTATFSTLSKLQIRRGIEVRCGNLRVSECDLLDAEKGIVIHQLANPHITGCSLRDITKYLVYIHPGGLGLLEGNTMAGQGLRDSVGFFLDNAGAAQIRGNTISKTMIGVYACNGCKETVVEDNILEDITAQGIYLDRGSKPTITANEIRNCGHYGILVSGQSTGILSKNICHSAIRVHTGARPSFYDNIIVLPAAVVNDAAVFALTGITPRRKDQLPKKKKAPAAAEGDDPAA